jgi:hypothetical protein
MKEVLMRRTGITGVLGTCLLLLAGRSTSAEIKPIETFTAFGVQMSAGASARITITIERWTTDEEREALLNILKEKGQKELTAVLFKRPRVGYIRLPNTRGYDLKYARSMQNPDGSRKVVVATDRDLGIREAASSSRSKQYNFAVAEIHLPKSGEGEGKLAPATLIAIDKATNQIEIENYSNQPVRLMKVTSTTE